METIYIIPASLFVIFEIIMLLAVLGGATELLDWFYQNLQAMLTIGVLLSIISFILTIYFVKKYRYSRKNTALSCISNILCSASTVFFFVNSIHELAVYMQRHPFLGAIFFFFFAFLIPLSPVPILGMPFAFCVPEEEKYQEYTDMSGAIVNAVAAGIIMLFAGLIAVLF